MTKRIAESRLDRMVEAHTAESERWCSRCAMDKSHYQIVRNSSENNDINADDTMTVYDLHPGFDHDDAQEMFAIRRDRAAMRAALVAGRFL